MLYSIIYSGAGFLMRNAAPPWCVGCFDAVLCFVCCADQRKKHPPLFSNPISPQPQHFWSNPTTGFSLCADVPPGAVKTLLKAPFCFLD